MTADSVSRSPHDSLAPPDWRNKSKRPSGAPRFTVDGHQIGGALPADIVVFDYTNQAWVKAQRYVACGHVDACRCYGKSHAGEPADVHTHCDYMEHGLHVAADCPRFLG